MLSRKEALAVNQVMRLKIIPHSGGLIDILHGLNLITETFLFISFWHRNRRARARYLTDGDTNAKKGKGEVAATGDTGDGIPSRNASDWL